jgi:hypothetical protein
LEKRFQNYDLTNVFGHYVCTILDAFWCWFLFLFAPWYYFKTLLSIKKCETFSVGNLKTFWMLTFWDCRCPCLNSLWKKHAPKAMVNHLMAIQWPNCAF